MINIMATEQIVNDKGYWDMSTEWVDLKDLLSYIDMLEGEQLSIVESLKGTPYFMPSKVACDNQIITLERIRKTLMYGDIANDYVPRA